jgi:hypothetical protein
MVYMMCVVSVCGGELLIQTQSDLHASMLVLQLMQSIQHSSVSWMCACCCLSKLQSMCDGLQLLCELCLPVHISIIIYSIGMRNFRCVDQPSQSIKQLKHLLLSSLNALQMPLKCHQISVYCLRCTLNLMQHRCDVI